MFADDTTLYFENTSAELLNYICQTELKNINKWLIYNRLSIRTLYRVYIYIYIYIYIYRCPNTDCVRRTPYNQSARSV